MTTPAALQLIFNKTKEELETKGIIAVKIITGSMEPVIKVNQTVIISKLTKPIERFDIIVFKGERELICHYVRHVNRHLTEAENNIIQTRGLHNKQDDYPIHQDQVLGIVISHRLNLWRKLCLIWAIR